jgi:hypothetical protein
MIIITPMNERRLNINNVDTIYGQTYLHNILTHKDFPSKSRLIFDIMYS